MSLLLLLLIGALLGTKVVVNQIDKLALQIESQSRQIELLSHPAEPSPTTAETCISGTFLVPNDWGGLIAIGDQDICGVNLHFGDVMQGYSSGRVDANQ